MSAAGGGSEADTQSWGIFHTSTRLPGGVSGSRDSVQADLLACKQVLQIITPPCQGQEGPSDHLACRLALQISAGRQPSEPSSDLEAGDTLLLSSRRWQGAVGMLPCPRRVWQWHGRANPSSAAREAAFSHNHPATTEHTILQQSLG